MKLGRVFAALARSNDRRFLELLREQSGLAVESLLLLQGAEREPGREDGAAAVKRVERHGDEVRRVLIDELMGTFSTPFDREDLFALSRSIDDIVDAADETARELVTYRVRPLAELGQMIDVLVDGARQIELAVGELLDHPLVAVDHAVRAKRCENRIDDLYHAALDSLFDGDAVSSEVLKAREIYRHLKNSADCIDRTADQISVIVIKRS